ncbi:MAG: hypothetical protein EOP80_07515 [Variovorax sp.]|nr:MAG: hypothetical protein EOP80_07515 [Variovorax sp.]
MNVPHRTWPPLAIIAIAAALRVLLDAPETESTALAIVILAALPWSLGLALLPPAPGFSEFAAWWVAGSIGVNLLLIWLAVAWLARRRRVRRRPRDDSRT